jgi:predicted dienelactone hydrolase
MPARWLKRWGIAAALLFGSALGVALWWLSPTFTLPPPGGPSRVGVRAFELVDESRRGLLGAAAHQPRRIPVRMWYPAANDARAPTRPYLEGYQARSLGRTFGEGRYFYAYLSRVKTHSMLDVPVKPARRAWPLVLFNHGFWSYPEQNTALMERLASHGYVVVSIGHPGDAVEMRFADGSAVQPFYDPDAPPERDAELEAGTKAFMGAADEDARVAGLRRFEVAVRAHRIGVSAQAWLDDNVFVLSALQRGDVPEAVSGLAKALDFDRLAVAGMSFGGSTAPSVCQRLIRCKAAVNLDGESFDFSMYDVELRAPLLLILTGQQFTPVQLDDARVNPTDYAYERWASAGEREDIVRMRVAAMRHLGLTDLPMSAPRPSSARLYGTLGGLRAVELPNDAILAFLDAHVRGRDGAFPRDFYAKYPEARPHDASHVKRWWLARKAGE